MGTFDPLISTVSMCSSHSAASSSSEDDDGAAASAVLTMAPSIVNGTESIQLIGVKRETKLITHDDIVSEIVRVGIASAAWMHLLLSKRSPRQRERRELREIERGGGDYYLPSQMREKRGRAPEINECVWRVGGRSLPSSR